MTEETPAETTAEQPRSEWERAEAAAKAAGKDEPEVVEAKTESKAEDKAEPEPKPDDEEDRDPTRLERVRFRQEKKALREKATAIEAREREQEQLFAAERRAWTIAHNAFRAGDPLTALQSLGFDVEAVAKALSEQALGKDPQVGALQRELADLRASLAREQAEQERRKVEAEQAGADERWTALVRSQLAESGDPILADIAKEPDLVAELKAIQAEHYEETDRLLPTVAAAKKLTARLQHAKTRLGRLFRDATSVPEPKPSAAVQLDRTSGKTRKPPRVVGSSKVEATSGGEKVDDEAAWKRKYARLISESAS